ncbi:hypothetical protein QL285_035953 [Trifolium repens]|nr:hypothetical protein QL285_035953 [Trifolium repens]
MLLEQCSLYQGLAATATYRRTDPAINGLEVRTDTPSTPPPPTPSTASAIPRPPPLTPTLAKTSQPPCAVWSQPNHTSGQTAHTTVYHPPKDRSRKKYLNHPPPSSSHAPETICPHAHPPPEYAQSPSTTPTLSALQLAPSLPPPHNGLPTRDTTNPLCPLTSSNTIYLKEPS